MKKILLFTLLLCQGNCFSIYSQVCDCSNTTLNLTGQESGPFPKEYITNRIQSSTYNNLNVKYFVTNSVLLNPGFSVTNNQIFSASIISCFSSFSSFFNVNNEGWRVSGDVQNGSSIPTYSSTGGNPNGHIYGVDNANGDVWYFVTPANILGGLKNAYGKTLKFDLKIDNLSSPYNNPNDIIITGNGVSINYTLPTRPILTWTTFSVPLTISGWKKNGVVITENEFKSILCNITKMWIRGEYRTGVDIGYLDNVKIE